MKVFVALVLILGSVSARGSGPYLPSGWRPDGPAFFLPSEVTKSAPSVVQKDLIQETEASGSDALREYGPPKLEISANVIQSLPDVATEKSFIVEFNQAINNVLKEAAEEEKTNQIAGEVSTATESIINESVQTVEEQSVELVNVQSTEDATLETVTEVESSTSILSEGLKELIVVPTAVVVEEIIVPTQKVEQEITEILEQVEKRQEVPIPTEQVEIQGTIRTVVEQVETNAVLTSTDQVEMQEAVPTATEQVEIREVRPSAVERVEIKEVLPTAVERVEIKEVLPTVVERVETQETLAVPVKEVNNIADALVNLEKEVKTIEVTAVENIADISSTQQVSGSLEQAPEGFLEYGPPGFAEYGPPKEENLARLAVEVVSSGLENNEVRRRRFSPKFKSTKH